MRAHPTMFNFDIDGIVQDCTPEFSLTAPAAAGLSALLGFLAEDPDVADVRWAAYMLATVRRECANEWVPLEEFGKGKGHAYGVPVTVTAPDGTTFTNTYYGRGYVQLTWKLNYARMSNALGMNNDLLFHPEHALEPQTSYKIMSFGMRNGSFTGKGLHTYIHDSTCDYLNARRIINGLDQAPLIAGYANKIENILRSHVQPATVQQVPAQPAAAANSSTP
ncbi:MAG TPA: hypothetical protein VK129_13395 [Terriglobales bacterium]|nr:hypothetical protein [Terriglobales bacterium]